MVLEDGPMLPPYANSQLKPQLFLKLGATFRSTYGVLVRVASVYLIPSPELFHGHTLSRPKGTQVHGKPSRLFLAYQQDLSISPQR